MVEDVVTQRCGGRGVPVGGSPYRTPRACACAGAPASARGELSRRSGSFADCGPADVEPRTVTGTNPIACSRFMRAAILRVFVRRV